MGNAPDPLPDIIPIFPLAEVLLLPFGTLPLNIFEPRYLAMVDEALSTHRLIGMIQPKEDQTLFDVGCAGRITQYQELSNGRYSITLTGVSRFRLRKEDAPKNGFRRANADWESFASDRTPSGCLGLDRAAFFQKLKTYFLRAGLRCDWTIVEKTADADLITALAMICPMSASEKQALLEAPCCKTRAQMFLTLLDLACTVNPADPAQH